MLYAIVREPDGSTFTVLADEAASNPNYVNLDVVQEFEAEGFTTPHESYSPLAPGLWRVSYQTIDEADHLVMVISPEQEMALGYAGEGGLYYLPNGQPACVIG